MSTLLTLSRYSESNTVRVLRVLIFFYLFNELFESLSELFGSLFERTHHVINSHRWNLVLLCTTRSMKIATAI